MADEKAFFVVDDVDEPTSDAIDAVAAEFAQLELEMKSLNSMIHAPRSQLT